MRASRSRMAAVAAACAMTATGVMAAARAPLPPMDWKRQVELLEAQVAALRAEVERLQRGRERSVGPQPLTARAAAPVRPPASALERLPNVWMLETGCPPGSVCLQVRCTDWGRP